MTYTPTLLLCLCCTCIACINAEGTVFLERGRRGIVPCPPITSRQVTREDTDAVYWYHRQRDRGSLLISYFRGIVAPQNGIPKGVYDIDSEFSLVIENVTASDEGFYFFLVKPKMKMVEDGHVEVCDKVSPSQPLPVVKGCDQHSDVCETRIGYNVSRQNLTCQVDAVKPAVELRWVRVLADGSEEQANASQTITEVVLRPNEGNALTNKTFSTSASIHLTSVNDAVEYRCEAHGVAVGNGSYILVRFVKAVSTTVADGETLPPENTGTTSVLTDEESPKVCVDEPAQPFHRRPVILAVAAVSLTVNAAVIIIMVFRLVKRHTDKKLALESTRFEKYEVQHHTANHWWSPPFKLARNVL